MTVLAASMAMVSGPTPPGTGVRRPALKRHPGGVDVAGKYRTSFGECRKFLVVARKKPFDFLELGHSVHPDIDHHRTGCHMLRTDQRADASRHNQNLGAARDLRQVTGSRVAHRDRGVCVEEEHGHWLADNVGAPDDHRPSTLDFDRVSSQHLHDAGGRARHEPRSPLLQ